MILTTKFLSGERLWVAAYHASIAGNDDYKPLSKADALKIAREDSFFDSVKAKFPLNLTSNEKGTKWECVNPDRPDIEAMTGSYKEEAYFRCLIATKIGPTVDYPFASSHGIGFISHEDVIEEEIADIPEDEEAA